MTTGRMVLGCSKEPTGYLSCRSASRDWFGYCFRWQPAVGLSVACLALLLAACTNGGNGEGTGTSPTAALTATAADTVVTGLDFPGSAGVTTTMRFKFDRPDLNGLPIYGPANAGVTYVWRAYPRQQGGYYTAFFWGNDDGRGTMDTFTWRNGGAETYYGAHPYPWPDWPLGGRIHQWEIAVDAGDYLNGAVSYERWHTQVLRVWSDANGKHHEFYWDWPNTDAAHVVRRDSPAVMNNVNPPSPALTWGDAPWSPGREVWCGILRGFQIYAAKLSNDEIQSEIATPFSTSAGASSAWYLNLNPTPSDISDKSGRNHHPVWVGTERPKLYSQEPQGPLPPVAADDAYATQAGTLLTVAVPGILTNDRDPNGDAMSALLVTSPANGTLTLNATGDFSYVANAGFIGTDTFTYLTSDGALSSAPAMVTLTVGSGNRPPVGTNDAYTAPVGALLTVAAPGVLGNDSDPDVQPISAVLATTTTNGTVTLNPTGGFTYRPNVGFTGTDLFTYRASDGVLQSNPVTVTLTVSGRNRAPVGVSNAYTVQAGVQLTVAAPGVLGNDSDPDGRPVSAVLAATTTSGILALAPTGGFTYLPNAGFTGTDRFTYYVTDGALQSSAVTVTLTVNGAATGAFSLVPSAMAYSGSVNGPNQVGGVTITNNLSMSLTVTWSDSLFWLVGTSGDTVTIPPKGSAVIDHTASMAGLRVGTYSGIATLRGGGTTKRVTVTLTIK